MPRKDRTYTNLDVLRIFCNNLDKTERNKVLLFYYVIVPAFFGFDFILDTITLLIPGRTGQFVQRLFSILGIALSKVKIPIIVSLLPPGDKKVIMECLETFDI